MHSTPSSWWDFGYYGVFACVFLEQIGVPIPAFPALLAAGALATTGDLSLFWSLVVAMTAALMADLIWYSIGRAKGGSVLNLMCRLSWHPDTCVTKTRSAFGKYGTKTLLISKFVPGLSTLAPPLAGITLVPISRFLAYDFFGTLIWALTPLLAGAYLGKGFTKLEIHYDDVGNYLPYVCGALILAVLIWRFVSRRIYIQNLRKALREGVSLDGLRQRLEANEDLMLIDVRDAISAQGKPVLLPKAVWIPYGDLLENVKTLPLKKPIVLYCDCVEDSAAVSAAEFLVQHGAKQARPLRGGLDGWIARGFPTVALVGIPMIPTEGITLKPQASI